MPTPCQKCFTIALAPYDCQGETENIASAVWVVTRTQAGGSGTVAFAGANGSFNISANGNPAVEEWTAAVTICNPTESAVLINYQVEADVTIVGPDGFCEISEPGIQGTNSSAVSIHLSPFGTLTIPSLTITTKTFTITCSSFGFTASNFTGTVVFTQP